MRSLQAAAAEAVAALRALTAVHLDNFDPIKPPIAPMPVRRMSDDEVVAWFETRELATPPRFDRAARQAARERAATHAAAELDTQHKRALDAQTRHQETLDAEWAKLLANDLVVVFETADDALDDNDATAAAIGYVGDSLAVVMTRTSESVVAGTQPGAGQQQQLAPHRYHSTPDHFLVGELQRRLAQDAKMRAEAAQRAPRNAAMTASLQTFLEWYQPGNGWKAWFGPRYLRDPIKAVEQIWEPEVGVVICVGLRQPAWVLALAEPQHRSPKIDLRVAAWTAGRIAETDTTGFDTVISPLHDLTTLGPLHEMKPPSARRRRRW